MLYMISTSCENLNIVTYVDLFVVFKTIKYIVSNYVIVLQIICVHKCFYIIFDIQSGVYLPVLDFAETYLQTYDTRFITLSLASVKASKQAPIDQTDSYRLMS